MSWADIKRKYESSEGTATQSTEDMAARRILRALGVTEPHLYQAERESGTGGLVSPDATLFERAVRLARNSTGAFYPPPTVMDVKNAKEAETALLELVDANKAKSVLKTPSVIYRIKGEKDLHAMLCLGDPEFLIVEKLPLPCRIRQSKDNGVLLADCDAQTYCNHAVKERAERNG